MIGSASRRAVFGWRSSIPMANSKKSPKPTNSPSPTAAVRRPSWNRSRRYERPGVGPAGVRVGRILEGKQQPYRGQDPSGNRRAEATLVGNDQTHQQQKKSGHDDVYRPAIAVEVEIELLARQDEDAEQDQQYADCERSPLPAAVALAVAILPCAAHEPPPCSAISTSSLARRPSAEIIPQSEFSDALIVLSEHAA
jgi:hypothetical protein